MKIFGELLGRRISLLFTVSVTNAIAVDAIALALGTDAGISVSLVIRSA